MQQQFKPQVILTGKGASKLMQSIQNNASLDEIKSHLKEAGRRDAEGRTALMYAVICDNEAAFDLLQPLECRNQDKSGSTALIYAAALDRVNFCKKLKESECDLTDSAGNNALFAAAGAGSKNCVAELKNQLIGRCNQRGATALMAAAAFGDVEVVQMLFEVEKGVCDQSGINALMVAASGGREEAVNILATSIDELKGREHQQLWGPLFCAASIGNGNICTTLIDAYNKFHLSIPIARDGATPLIVAAENGKIQAVKALISLAGQKRNDGVTALMMAAMQNHTEVALHLIEQEAGLDTKGFTALMAAAEKGNSTLCAALKIKEGKKIDQNGNPALFFAAQNGHVDAVKILADIPEERTAQSINKTNALSIAICNDRPEVVDILMAYDDVREIFNEMLKDTFLYGGKKKDEQVEENNKEEVENEQKLGLTPLMYAICQNATKCAKFFTEYEGGKYLKCQEDTYGNTALIYAIHMKNLELVKLLIPHENRMASFTGRTALMTAAEIGFVEAAKILVDFEGNMRDKNNFTALAIAATKRKLGVVKILIPVEGGELQGPSNQPAIFEAIKVNGDEIFLEMMEKEADIEDQNGLTALMIAATFGHRKAVDILKNKQAEKRDKIGNTALMFAAQVGNSYAVKALLKHEAGMTNNAGTTALMAAALMGHADCVKNLVKDEKCRMNITKQTALIIAVENRHLQCAQLLLDYEGDIYVYDGRTNIIVETFRAFPKENKFIEAVLKKVQNGYKVLTTYEKAVSDQQDAKIIKQNFTKEIITEHSTQEAKPTDFITDQTPKRIRQLLENL